MLHIAESGFVDRSQRLSDEVYAQVLDSIVVCCADCAVVCGEDILLGRRIDEPAKGQLWIMGGRMKVGDDPRQTVRRILKREIGLDIPSYQTIIDINLTISYVWEKRSQPPAGHGCHMVGLYHMVSISKEKKEDLSTSLTANPNFSEFVWMPAESMVNNMSLHEGIRAVAKSVLWQPGFL